MGFEPQKFFLGLIDFFSVLLPGAALLYLARPWSLAEGEQVGVFVFASYVAGHAIFLAAAYLDSLLYDRVRRWTEFGQTIRLANGQPLSPRWSRKLAQRLFPGSPDAALIEAIHLKARAMDNQESWDAINAFQWAKARLTKELPEGLLTVQRFEASSKFFRSFSLVLAVLAGLYFWRGDILLGMACIAGIGLALGRYIEQRYKSTQQAYWFLLTLEQPPPAKPRWDELTHAGGIVSRTGTAGTEYLLVQASRNREHWLLPKGHIEPGETPRVTAVREVLEEAGCWARITGWQCDETLYLPTGRIVVRWFRMELEEEPVRWPSENRARVWLPLDQAIERATFKETKELLRQAASAPARNKLDKAPDAKS
jgi:8-oxo-dGTP pyrophosphatase MutT (NUDIX family)